MALPDGLYDLLLTERLATQVDPGRADVVALNAGVSGDPVFGRAC